MQRFGAVELSLHLGAAQVDPLTASPLPTATGPARSGAAANFKAALSAMMSATAETSTLQARLRRESAPDGQEKGNVAAEPVVASGAAVSPGRNPLQGAAPGDDAALQETATKRGTGETEFATTSVSKPVGAAPAERKPDAEAAGSPSSGAQIGGASSARPEAAGKQTDRCPRVQSRLSIAGTQASGAAAAIRKAQSRVAATEPQKAGLAQPSPTATGAASEQKSGGTSEPAKIPVHATQTESVVANASVPAASAAPASGSSNSAIARKSAGQSSLPAAQHANPVAGERRSETSAEAADQRAPVDPAAHSDSLAQVHSNLHAGTASAGVLPVSAGNGPGVSPATVSVSAGAPAVVAPVQHTAAVTTAGPDRAASAAHTAASAAFERMDVAAAPRVLESAPQRLSVGVQDSGLGWIEVRAHAGAGQVSAVVASASGEAHNVLTAHLPEVREYLAGQQVHVDQLTSESFSSSADRRDSSSRNEAQGEKAVRPGRQNAAASAAGEAGGESLSYINVRV